MSALAGNALFQSVQISTLRSTVQKGTARGMESIKNVIRESEQDACFPGDGAVGEAPREYGTFRHGETVS